MLANQLVPKLELLPVAKAGTAGASPRKRLELLLATHAVVADAANLRQRPSVPCGGLVHVQSCFEDTLLLPELLVRQFRPPALLRLLTSRITIITANQGQINTALTAALAAVTTFKARIVPSRFGLLAAITGEAPVPDNPFGKYVNISMLFEASSDGLKIGRLSVGEIEIPTAIVRPVFILVMDQVAGLGRGRAFLETIRSVQVTGP